MEEKMSKSFVLFSLGVIMATLLIACAAPAPTQAPAAPKPTDVPKPTTAAQPTAIPTAAAGPKRGGKVTYAMWQSPVSLNPLIINQTVVDRVLDFIVEGMTTTSSDGERIPVLAKEVPSVKNGGVSADGKTITYKLKEGLLWSDGKPVTCDDVKFNWQVRMTPGIGIVSTTGYSSIETVECPDPLTAVVKYKNFYAPYLTLFNALVPKSAGEPKDIKNWEYNRKPIGTGPFKVQEWATDDHITLVRNENYRDAKVGKPYLDQIIIRIVPSTDVALQLMVSGEVDVVWRPPEDQLDVLAKVPGVKVVTMPSRSSEKLFLNLGENKDPADPTKPHAILGDVRVRQALAYGINRQPMVDQLMNGRTVIGSNEITQGFFKCDIKPYPFDPEKAKTLLTEAGWVPGADGIRVAKGAKNAPDGTRLRLKLSTTSGSKAREDAQVLIMQNMRAIGVDIYLENMPSAVLIGNWAAASPRKRGNFDILLYADSPEFDPHTHMAERFLSTGIPSEKNTGGVNHTRFNDPKVDDLLKQAGSEPDVDKRKVMYCQVETILHESSPIAYLWAQVRAFAWRERVQGVSTNEWSDISWNAQEWWLK
jgi:peptide/nickel transport system substrate-binding protein